MTDAPARPLRVVLVDDEHLIRSALATMLSLEEIGRASCRERV